MNAQVNQIKLDPRHFPYSSKRNHKVIEVRDENYLILFETGMKMWVPKRMLKSSD